MVFQPDKIKAKVFCKSTWIIITYEDSFTDMISLFRLELLASFLSFSVLLVQHFLNTFTKYAGNGYMQTDLEKKSI